MVSVLAAVRAVDASEQSGEINIQMMSKRVKPLDMHTVTTQAADEWWRVCPKQSTHLVFFLSVTVSCSHKACPSWLQRMHRMELSSSRACAFSGTWRQFLASCVEEAHRVQMKALELRLALLHDLEWCPNSPHLKQVMFGQSPVHRKYVLSSSA
jgi:hypothetical protein